MTDKTNLLLSKFAKKVKKIMVSKPKKLKEKSKRVFKGKARKNFFFVISSWILNEFYIR